MKIRTDSDISGPIAKGMRLKLGLSQPDFWGAVRVKQSIASKYESGLRLPDPIKLLLFIRYVAGVNLDPGTPAGAASLRRLGKITL